ncbi:unnamed protein product [Microthlaspi erraticum]|uniref:AMP-activated protein kinase glycogen-binding domain-containing protein n=1 Tax=Microthlaspi erraticum TaxID=1685480 RepID=A0A6D2JH42_9BRAS|nr:unnamed protein product [Microthlaspi erraticum]
MVSINSGPISSLVYRNSLIDSSDSLLPLSCFCTNYSTKTCIRFASLNLLAARKGCGPVLGFLEANPRKKGCCFRFSGVLRMCNNRNPGWESEESKDLETEILEFMENSEKPGMFPSKKDLIRCGRFDLVERIVNQGGWLSMGWDSDEQEEAKVNQNVMLRDLPIEKQLRNRNSQAIDAFDLASSPSSLREEVDDGNESGIEGILTRLEKERNSSLGISLSGKGESNGAMNDNTSPNGLVPRSSMIVKTASEFLEAKPVSGTRGLSELPTSETWRTWSMRRAGFTDEDFEAAEISSSGLDGVKKDNTNKDSGDGANEKDTTSSSPEDINTSHIKSRLQNLQSELSSVLHSLRSNPDEVVTSKDSETNSGNLENVYDDWEYKENEIIHAQSKLRSTRAKLAVLEGKMAMAIIDAQRIVREKQRKIDHASRALRLLRTASIVWPNSASEVLLTGSFDGWSTQRKMKKAENGVFSLTLKLYPGKYEVKFIVDGQWKVDPLRPIVTCNGYENNVLIIS